MSKRAVLYARVSTDEQAERGYSLPTQLEACRKYAEAQDYTVVKEFKDDCSGTIRMSDRPQGREMQAMLERKEADAVIVYTSDRLTRNLAHSLILREQWQKAGVELHYANRGKSENTPESRFTENMEGVFNEYWKERIVEASKRNKNKWAREGHLILSFPVPFGYRKEGKGKEARLFKFASEVQTTKQIFEWFVRGTEKAGPLSINKICETLDKLYVPTPQGKRKRRAHCWLVCTVVGILRNEIYAGVTYFGKSRKVDGKVVDQPRNQWIKIEVPDLAIIDRATFEAAQRRFERNKQLSLRNSRNRYLMTGHFRCGECRRVISGKTSKSGSGSLMIRYCCTTNRFTGRDGKACKYDSKVYLDARKVEGKIWGWLVELLSDDESVEEGLNLVAAKRAAEVEPKRRELRTVKCSLDEAQSELDRLVSAIGREKNETLRTAIQEKARRVAQNRDALMIEHDKLTYEIEQRIISAQARQNILRMARDIRRKINGNPSFERKREVLDALDVQAVLRIEDEKRLIDVTCGMLEESTTIDLSSYSRTPPSASTHPRRPLCCKPLAACR